MNQKPICGPIEHGIPKPGARPIRTTPRLIDYGEGMEVGASRSIDTWGQAKSITTALRSLKDGRTWSLRHDGQTWRIWRNT